MLVHQVAVVLQHGVAPVAGDETGGEAGQARADHVSNIRQRPEFKKLWSNIILSEAKEDLPLPSRYSVRIEFAHLQGREGRLARGRRPAIGR